MIWVWKSHDSLSLEEQRQVAKEMLEEALFRTLGKKLKEVEIHRNQHGKPFFPKEKELHFSISHCNDAVALCLCKNPCGIDIEKVRPMSSDAARIVLSQEEKELLEKVDEKEYYFFALWVLKESIVKCLGSTVGPAMKNYSFPNLFLEERSSFTNNKEKNLPIFQVETQGIWCSLYNYGEYMIAQSHTMPLGHKEKESLTLWKRAVNKA